MTKRNVWLICEGWGGQTEISNIIPCATKAAAVRVLKESEYVRRKNLEKPNEDYEYWETKAGATFNRWAKLYKEKIIW